MSIEVKNRRGTTIQHSVFTGAEGEVTYDTDKKTLIAHDGTTVGGHELLKTSESFNETLLINGGMQVWQRGTSIALIGGASNTYAQDRWVFHRANNTDITVSRVSGFTLGDATSQFMARLQRDVGQTGTGYIMEQPFAGNDVARVRGKVLTLSFIARVGADFSSAGNLLQVRIMAGTDSPAPRGFVGYTTETTPIFASPALTTSATKYEFTSTVIPTTTNQLSVFFSIPSTGTAGANDWIEIDSIKLEIGDTATPYVERDQGEELALCQQYYQKSFPQVNTPQQNLGITSGGAVYHVHNTGIALDSVKIVFSVVMRGIPTMTYFNPNAANANWRNFTDNVDSGVVATQHSGDSGLIIRNTQIATDTVDDRIGINWTAESEI